MEHRYLHFVTLLSDHPDKDILDEFAADLKKAHQITEVLQNQHPSVSFHAKLLWDIPQGAHEELIDKGLEVHYPKLQFKNSKESIAIERILWREEDIRKKSLSSAQKDGDYSYVGYDQSASGRTNYMNIFDISSYETERLNRGNKTALSNILIASMAAQHPEVSYINLADLSIEKAKEFAREIAQTPSRKIRHEDEYIRYMSSTDDPNDIFARRYFNHQRNLRYESLAKEFENRESFLYRFFQPLRELFQNKEKYRKQSTLKAYLKNKYISQLTGQGLAREIRITPKPESFWRRLKNKTFRSFAFLNKLSKEEKKAMQELNKGIPLHTNAFHFLSTALESVKEDYPRVDGKKIARLFIKKQGKSLWESYRDDAGKSDVNGKDELGYTPLYLVATSRELVELLVEEFNADVNAKCKSGESVAFSTATFGKNTELLRYLKEKGARLEQKDSEGNNILYGMVRDHKQNNGIRDLTNNFHYLLEQGLNPADENSKGESASDRAYLENKQDLYDIFLKAYPEIQERFVWKPLELSLKMDEILNDVSPETRRMFEDKRSDSDDESASLASSARAEISSVSTVDIEHFLQSDARQNHKSSTLERKDSGYESNDPEDYITDVPGDGNCALHAMATTYLLAVIDNDAAFNERFKKLFGDIDIEKLEEVKDLMKRYQPQENKYNNLYVNTTCWNELIHSFRHRIVEQMRLNKEKYEPFIVIGNKEDCNAENFQEYLKIMEKDGTYLGNQEIVAASELLNCRINIESDKTNHSYNEKVKDSIDLRHANKNHYQFKWNQSLPASPSIKTRAINPVQRRIRLKNPHVMPC